MTLRKRQNLKRGMTGGKPRETKEVPAWIRAVPHGSRDHGSGPLQKKLWRVTSDFVRIRDWHEYGACAATGKRLEHWRNGQAGHFKAWTKCNAIAKFDTRNIHLQGAQSNSWGDFEDWKTFEAELIRRGYDLEQFHRDNLALQGAQLKETDVIAKLEETLTNMGALREQPDYYPRAIKLLQESVLG
jgi:hypothetical protein